MRSLSLLLCFLCLYVASLWSQSDIVDKDLSEVINSKMQDQITEFLEPFLDNSQVSFAIVKDGKVSFYGLEKLDGKWNEKDNRSSVFEIGSITKVFTSTLLANAVLEGKLSLNDPINNYLDFKLNQDISITFSSLANHTSGLPRISKSLMGAAIFDKDPYVKFDDESMKKYLSEELKLEYEQGEKSSYSNMGAGVLGYTLEQVYEQELEALFQNKIFKKYGMKNSSIILEKVEDAMIDGRDANGKVTPHWQFDAMAGAGAIYSSVDQLVHFAIAQIDSTHAELALTQKPTFKIKKKLSVGLAWHLITRKDGREILWHNGGTAGFTSHMSIDKANNNAIVILSNISAFHPKHSNIDYLGFDLLKELAN